MHATLSTRDITLVRAFIYTRLKIHAPLLHATCNHPTIKLFSLSLDQSHNKLDRLSPSLLFKGEDRSLL
jgi:hypothetical protein